MFESEFRKKLLEYGNDLEEILKTELKLLSHNLDITKAYPASTQDFIKFFELGQWSTPPPEEFRAIFFHGLVTLEISDLLHQFGCYKSEIKIMNPLLSNESNHDNYNGCNSFGLFSVDRGIVLRELFKTLTDKSTNLNSSIRIVGVNEELISKPLDDFYPSYTPSISILTPNGKRNVRINRESLSSVWAVPYIDNINAGKLAWRLVMDSLGKELEEVDPNLYNQQKLESTVLGHFGHASFCYREQKTGLLIALFEKSAYRTIFLPLKYGTNLKRVAGLLIEETIILNDYKYRTDISASKEGRLISSCGGSDERGGHIIVNFFPGCDAIIPEYMDKLFEICNEAGLVK